MKKLFLILALVHATSAFSAPAALLCTWWQADEVLAIARKHSSNDKNNHCSVSCMLAVRCSRPESAIGGFLKEIKDVFGPGNAEMSDLRANRVGLGIVTGGRASNDNECLEQCSNYYRP